MVIAGNCSPSSPSSPSSRSSISSRSSRSSCSTTTTSTTTSSTDSRSRHTQYLRALQDHTIPEHHSRRCYGDRFIPDRSSMDFDMVRYLLLDERKGKENEKDASSMPKEIYRKHLSEALMMDRTRILSFWRKPSRPNNEIFQEGFFDNLPANQVKPSRPFRCIPQTPVRTLDAPDLINDYHLNLLDWSNSNTLAIALGNSVYLWDASNGSSRELLSVDEVSGPVTSVSWAPNGQHIAVGLNSSVVELWDASVNQKLRNLQGGHQGRVGALSWNKHILTTGGIDCKVINNDVRVRSHIVQTFRGHRQEICALKWSGTGKQLASGGDDRLLYIWDQSMASSNSPNQWFHRFNNHEAAVKALAWSPFQSDLLASGGGVGDHSIKFWNTHSGTHLKSIDTGSEVCSLLWSNNEKELLSSHALMENQLILWKYPSMVKIAELSGHTSRVLFMAQSPDGCTVASAEADERLCFWNVFGTPEVNKPKRKKENAVPFSNWMSHIR